MSDPVPEETIDDLEPEELEAALRGILTGIVHTLGLGKK